MGTSARTPSRASLCRCSHKCAPHAPVLTRPPPPPPLTHRSHPPLPQVVEELTEALPGIFAGHALTQAWAYKYDSEIASGIDVHADTAAVNVNFWLTEDDACESCGEGGGGGIVVLTAASAEGMEYEVYNTYAGTAQVSDLLAATNYQNATTPYKCNRAVIFRSDLFHTTDRFAFKKGYCNRRINFTLLFGHKLGAPRTAEY